jgi:Ca2+/Na+ antiporter
MMSCVFNDWSFYIIIIIIIIIIITTIKHERDSVLRNNLFYIYVIVIWC